MSAVGPKHIHNTATCQKSESISPSYIAQQLLKVGVVATIFLFLEYVFSYLQQGSGSTENHNRTETGVTLWTNQKDSLATRVGDVSRNTSSPFYQEVPPASKPGIVYRHPEKRAAEQATFTTGPQQYFFPTQKGTPSTQRTLCFSGNEGILQDTYLQVSINEVPRVQLFTLNGATMQLIQNQSANITSQLSSLTWTTGWTTYTSSCSQGRYQILNFANNPGSYLFTNHYSIENDTLVIPPYYAMEDFNWFPYPIPTYPYNVWKPTPLLGNQVMMPFYNTTGSFLAQTNATGQFPLGTFYRTIARPLASNATYQDGISFDDGSSTILTNQPNGSQQAWTFDPNGTLTGTYTIANGTLPGIGTYNTPLPAGTPYAAILSTGTNQTTPTISSFDLVNKRITNNQQLSQNTTPITHPSIAHCGPQYPTIAFTAWEETGKIRFAFIDASNANSILEGAYNNTKTNTTLPSMPQVACSNNVGMVAYGDGNQDASLFTVTFQLNSPSPTPVSSPTLSPLLPQPPSITIYIPSNLTQNFIPITAEIINISQGVVSVKLTDANGYEIVFAANHSAVPLNVSFTPDEIYKFDIAQGSATPGSVPEFEGCNSVDQCSPSQKGPLKGPGEQVFGNGIKLEIVIPTVLGAAGLAGVVAYLVWRCEVKDLRKKHLAGEEYTRTQLTESKFKAGVKEVEDRKKQYNSKEETA
jgi:hypothetical protein